MVLHLVDVEDATVNIMITLENVILYDTHSLHCQNLQRPSYSMLKILNNKLFDHLLIYVFNKISITSKIEERSVLKRAIY